MRRRECRRIWYRSLNRHLLAPARRVLHATGLDLWYLLLGFVSPADSGRMNGKRKKTRRQRQNVDIKGPETLEWPAIQLSMVSSAPCWPLKEQTRLVQEQRGQSTRG